MKTTWRNQPDAAPGRSCIWMQAGVVRRRDCDNDYQCESCRFDRAIRRAADHNRRLGRSGQRMSGKRGRIVSWQERLRALPLGRRPCLHYLKGRIDFKACTHDYRCRNCEFDQFFDDQYAVHTVVKPMAAFDVKGFKLSLIHI